MMLEKSYSFHITLFMVQCIDNSGTVMLHLHQVYEVVDYTDDLLLIRFRSGGAKWYSLERFTKDLYVPPRKKVNRHKIILGHDSTLAEVKELLNKTAT